MSVLGGVLCSALAAMFGVAQPAAQRYDPLAVSPDAGSTTRDLVVHDTRRSRNIPVLVYLPPSQAAAPVVLFSHGLGGARTGSSFLGRHWSARGFVAVFLQHPGSDEAVWRDVPFLRRVAALRRAANAENFLLRARDVKVVIDELTQWNRQDGHDLQGRLDMARVGMSGHSFGAITAQAVSGQAGAAQSLRLTDQRIKAAILMSPSAPSGSTPEAAFATVPIPWFLMTGTQDESVIGTATVQSRLQVFPALPPGGKYELVLFDGQHSAFTDRDLPGDRLERNPNHHRVIRALSTAFWDSFLRDDPAARRWLDGTAPRQLLEARDGFKKK